MIKNLLFDLAGVVMNLNLERDTIALHNAGFPDFEECCRNPIIREPMLKYLNGLCSEAEFLERIHPLCNTDATDDDIRWAMNAVLDDIPLGRIQRIIQLRKKYKVYLITNIYHDAWNHTLNEIHSKGYELNDIFDQAFLSYELMLAKPDPRIFKVVIDSTGILPQETLYFDDSRENIETGKQLGFQTQLVSDNDIDSQLALL